MAKTVTLGLMSGTSLDGVDAVAVDFSGVGPRLIGHHHIEFPKPLKEKLLALCQPGDNEIDRMGVASVELGKFYVHCINELLDVADIGRKDVAAVGIHGQTIRHRPEQGWTLQLNNPALVAELSGLDVVSDFRSRDIAAGGEGAPLVPAFHRQVFMGEVARSVVNIGGIANVTFLPPRRGYGKIIGFDCGPGNILLDAWCRKHIARPYDTNGAWGATGRVHDDLLAKLLSDPYFDRQPPKSTGREHFNLEWLESQLGRIRHAGTRRRAGHSCDAHGPYDHRRHQEVCRPHRRNLPVRRRRLERCACSVHPRMCRRHHLRALDLGSRC